MFKKRELVEGRTMSGLKGLLKKSLHTARYWAAVFAGLYVIGFSPDLFGYDMTISWFNPPENDADLKAIYIEYKFTNNKNDIGPPYDGSGIKEGPSPIKVYADQFKNWRNPTYPLNGVPKSTAQGRYLVLALRSVDALGNCSPYSSTICDPAEKWGNNDSPMAATEGTELSFPAHRAGKLSGENSWDSDGTVRDFNWRITDESGWEKWISGKNAFWEPPQEGQYFVQLFVTDDRGKGSQAGAVVRVEPGDWEGPTVYIEDFAGFNDQLSLTGTVCDDAGIGGLELEVNGMDVPFSVTNAGPLCWDFESSEFESGGDGKYVWKVAAWDNNKNHTSKKYTQTIITAPSMFETDTEAMLGSDGFSIRSEFTGTGITDAYYSFQGIEEIITLTPQYVAPDKGYLTIDDPDLFYSLVKEYGQLRFFRTLVNGLGTEVTQTGTLRFESEDAPGKRLVIINGLPMFSMDDGLAWENRYPGVIEIDQDYEHLVEGTASLALTYTYNPARWKRSIWTPVPTDRQDITGKKKALVWIRCDNDVVLGLRGSNDSGHTSTSWFNVRSGESVYEVALENWGDFIDRFYLRILGGQSFKASIDNIVFADDVVEGPVRSGDRLRVNTDSLDRWNVDRFPEIISVDFDRDRKTEGDGSLLVDYTYNPAFSEGYVSHLIGSADRDCSGMDFVSFFGELEGDEPVQISIFGENGRGHTPIEWLTIAPGAGYYIVDISHWERDDLKMLNVGFLGAEGIDYRLRLDDIELSGGAQLGGNFEWMRFEDFNEEDWVHWNSEVFSLGLDSDYAHSGTSLRVDCRYDRSAGRAPGIGKEVSAPDLRRFDTLRIWSKADFVYGAETAAYGIMAKNAGKYTNKEWFEIGEESGFSNVSLLGVARDAWDYFYITFDNVEGKDHSVYFDSITLVDTKGEPSVVWSKDKNEAIVIRYDRVFGADASGR